MSVPPKTIWTITALGKRKGGRQVVELPLARCLGFSNLRGRWEVVPLPICPPS